MAKIIPVKSSAEARKVIMTGCYDLALSQALNTRLIFQEEAEKAGKSQVLGLMPIHGFLNFKRAVAAPLMYPIMSKSDLTDLIAASDPGQHRDFFTLINAFCGNRPFFYGLFVGYALVQSVPGTYRAIDPMSIVKTGGSVLYTHVSEGPLISIAYEAPIPTVFGSFGQAYAGQANNVQVSGYYIFINLIS